MEFELRPDVETIARTRYVLFLLELDKTQGPERQDLYVYDKKQTHLLPRVTLLSDPIHVGTAQQTSRQYNLRQGLPVRFYIRKLLL